MTPLAATEAERQKFEAWAQANRFDTKLRNDIASDDTYFRFETEQRWIVWQAARASQHSAAQATAEPPYRVAEFWSSANPRKKVRMLAEGDDIVQWAKRGDFIRWVDAAPDRAPSTDSAADARDAARYRFLEHQCRTGTYRGIISRKAIDAAIAAFMPHKEEAPPYERR